MQPLSEDAIRRGIKNIIGTGIQARKSYFQISRDINLAISPNDVNLALMLKVANEEFDTLLTDGDMYSNFHASSNSSPNNSPGSSNYFNNVFGSSSPSLFNSPNSPGDTANFNPYGLNLSDEDNFMNISPRKVSGGMSPKNLLFGASPPKDNFGATGQSNFATTGQSNFGTTGQSNFGGPGQSNFSNVFASSPFRQ